MIQITQNLIFGIHVNIQPQSSDHLIQELFIEIFSQSQNDFRVEFLLINDLLDLLPVAVAVSRRHMHESLQRKVTK